MSCEPLLDDLGELDLSGIDWVIVGGESGCGARPCNPNWVRNIQRQCKEQNVVFFFKQWGEWQPIEFKNGFIINCNLRIEREKKKNDEEKRRYIVTEVISYVINEKAFETMEGKRYKQAKKDEADSQYLPFDELSDNEE